MSTGVKYKDYNGTVREVDRFSTILGMPARIMQPLGTPKPREECQPFTFALYAGNDSRARNLDVKAQEKFAKQLNTLLAKQAREAAKRAKRAAK